MIHKIEEYVYGEQNFQQWNRPFWLISNKNLEFGIA